MSTDRGTASNPWKLKTPPLSSEFTMHRDQIDGEDILVCTVGKTVLHYDARCIEDLHEMLLSHGDWMELGSADEQKDAKAGTVEAWARSKSNPVQGWYGKKKGLRGRFGMYVPPLLEELGLAEVEHNPRGNRMKAKTASLKKSTTKAKSGQIEPEKKLSKLTAKKPEKKTAKKVTKKAARKTPKKKA